MTLTQRWPGHTLVPGDRYPDAYGEPSLWIVVGAKGDWVQIQHESDFGGLDFAQNAQEGPWLTAGREEIAETKSGPSVLSIGAQKAIVTFLGGGRA